ncbi:MAG: exopolyphosphatase [Gammaproteobacteria bacterium]
MTSFPNEYFAAVDLGSNSFHMIVANYSEDRLQIVDRLKEMVRLASGLDSNNCLTEESIERAIDCLQRFGQRIREIPRVNVRAVGTNTLRQARNGADFLDRAYRTLGHPIEIIAGREEARLIYMGVSHTIYNKKDRRLLIDIGGGSTEAVIGRGFEPHYMESLYMGCVSMSQRFFGNGDITAKKMRKAILFARLELESIETTYKRVGWDSVIGSSGTNISINDTVTAQGWSKSGITAESLENLKETMLKIGKMEKLDLEGLPEARKAVFPGGVAILCAAFEALQIERMDVSDGALREGLLHDLIGRLHDEDTRDKTIAGLMQRYAVDSEQAQRVEATSTILFAEVRKAWGLSKKPDLQLLHWASQIHEIGLSIAHAQHHRHGAYLLSHSDLPGFSSQEQLSLAMLVRAHRRKFPVEEMKEIQHANRRKIKYLAILLRLAVVLHRSRSHVALPQINADTGDDSLKLEFPEGWLDQHPLTRADLDTETDYLDAMGFKVIFD